MNSLSALLYSAIAASALVMTGRAAAQSVELLNIEERSGYEAPGERNPFWPIGWTPPDPNAGPVVVKNEVDTSFLTPARFTLSSISIDRLPLALINGRTYGEGDLIAVSPSINVAVAAIRDGEVDLRYRDKTITIQLTTGGRPKRQQRTK